MLEFNNVYFYRNNTKFNTTNYKQSIYHNRVQLNFNDILIFAPPLYITLIKNSYFEQYISKNICHHYMDSEIESFYCDKSSNFTINNLKTFPTLYFEHIDLNYTFELTYKDLFVEKDNKYIFMIFSEIGDIDEWFFGDLFFRKYQLAFNQDSKIISFYNHNSDVNTDNEEDDYDKKTKTIIIKEKENIIYIILIAILCCIICIVLGFIIGKFLQKNRTKKKANELDDDYEYISENQNTENIN